MSPIKGGLDLDQPSHHQQNQQSNHNGHINQRTVRKGTRSCWNCKHRKVRCIFGEGEQVCRECIARGIACRTQDQPEPQGSDRVSLNERVGRIEQLLERVLDKLDDGSRSSNGAHTTGSERDALRADATVAALASAAVLEEAPESLVEQEDMMLADTPSAQENAPILTLFDSSVFGRRESEKPAASASSIDGSSPAADVLSPKLQQIRRELCALVPSQAVLDKLSASSNGWWMIRVQSFQDSSESLLSVPAEALPHSYPATVALSLMWIAISLQQLPAGFDTAGLGLRSASPAQWMQQCLSTITAAFARHEYLAHCIEGVECVVLQAIFLANAGQLRTSWYYYRRAISFAQIIGLHRPVSKIPRDADWVRRGKVAWWHMIGAERYLSLILGFHYAVSDAALRADSGENDLGMGGSYMRGLYRIAGAIIDRNQSFTGADDPGMMAATRAIDADFEALSREVPAEWWHIEHDDTFYSAGKSTEGATHYSRLMVQHYHHNLEALLHLPLMLHADAEASSFSSSSSLPSTSEHRRYEYAYNRQRCLSASRRMISCYLCLRKITTDSFCSKTVDFEAFTAATTLLINLLGPNQADTDRDDLATRRQDWEYVHHVIRSLEHLTKAQPDQVATQALGVLRVLTNASAQDIPDGDGEGQSSIRLAIPYFGTVCLQRARPRHTPSLIQDADGNGRAESNEMMIDGSQPAAATATVIAAQQRQIWTVPSAQVEPPPPQPPPSNLGFADGNNGPPPPPPSSTFLSILGHSDSAFPAWGLSGREAGDMGGEEDWFYDQEQSFAAAAAAVAAVSSSSGSAGAGQNLFAPGFGGPWGMGA